MQRVILYLIDVGVPHLGEEPEGWWGVWVVYRELDPRLGHKNRSLHAAVHCVDYILLNGIQCFYKKS